MHELPRGVVTFLMTDVEGSTTRWADEPAKMRVDLAADYLCHTRTSSS